jgi:hypothetical protein
MTDVERAAAHVRLPTVPGELASLPLRIAFVVVIGGAMSLAMLLSGGCGNDHNSTGPDAAVDPDPLAITDTAAPGSLDDIHERIIAKRCSGQPGLCHNGQFEPNLSTPGLAYAYLVNRPGIEHPTELRVKPGDPASSLFIDKVRNRNVATQMPLGAEPLADADIAELEAWITAGALRAPGADPAPVLNNPPKGDWKFIHDAGRIDLDTTYAGLAPLTASAVSFATAPTSRPPTRRSRSRQILAVADGRNVVLNAGATDPHVGQTTYDAAGLMGKYALDFRGVTIPMLPLYDRTRRCCRARRHRVRRSASSRSTSTRSPKAKASRRSIRA